MLDHFTIFTKGGVVLWSYSAAKLKGSPINQLVRTVLLEERGAQTSHNIDQYTLKWTFANELELVFVVVYQKIIQLLYIEELLELVKHKFIDTYRENLVQLKSKGRDGQFDDFDELFQKILTGLENQTLKQKKERVDKGPRSFYDTDKAKQLKKEKKEEENKREEIVEEAVQEEEDEPQQSNADDTDSTGLTQEQIQKRLEQLKLKKSGPKSKGKSNSFKSSMSKSTTSPGPTQKKGRTWDDATPKVADLDYSAKFNAGKEPSDSSSKEEQFQQKAVDLDDWTNQLKQQTKAANATKQEGRFMSFFKTLSGDKVLDAHDLEPVLAEFKQHLTAKNVAADIADQLCNSVSASLQGKKVGSFTGIKATVKAALEEALVRILTPKRNIDVLRDVIDANKEGRPYTIAFVGVNGVGKSTNLAKVCSYLQQNGHSVMLAACDTFRSGAVEQLHIHAKRLNVEIFEKGYRSEPTAIAVEAVKYAKNNGMDVVLIDTAGRMQDNEPLMKALSKLVNTVKPDLVLFVGEALVGNDAVDQLTKFNQALMDLSTEKEPRLIDGIILTKFDTIDDKVGAALSMVYTTGAPIVFLGVGQTYSDLRRMNVHVVTKALLKGS